MRKRQQSIEPIILTQSELPLPTSLSTNHVGLTVTLTYLRVLHDHANRPLLERSTTVSLLHCVCMVRGIIRPNKLAKTSSSDGNDMLSCTGVNSPTRINELDFTNPLVISRVGRSPTG